MLFACGGKIEKKVNLVNIYKDFDNLARVDELSSPTSIAEPLNRTTGLSVIVLNKDKPDLLEQVQSGFRKAVHDTDTNMELLIGDTGSSNQETLALYGKSESNETVVYLNNYHFSRNNNSLVKYAKYDTYLFLNNDVLIGENPKVLIKAWETFNQIGKKAILSAELVYPDLTLQHGGVDFMDIGDFIGLPYHPGHREQRSKHFKGGNYFESPAVTGAFLMIGSRKFFEAGGFDERYSKECQDIALCLEGRRIGMNCYVGNFGKLVHLENATRPKNEEDWSDRRRFLRKYGRLIEIMK